MSSMPTASALVRDEVRVIAVLDLVSMGLDARWLYRKRYPASHKHHLHPTAKTVMAIHRWFEDYVFEVSDFLPVDRCDELVEHAERQQFEEATVNTAAGHLRRENLRNNDRVISDDGSLSACCSSQPRLRATAGVDRRSCIASNPRAVVGTYGRRSCVKAFELP